MLKTTELINTKKMNMDILNTIGSVCSILGLLITIFVANQIISIKKTINDNSNNKVKQAKNKLKNGDIAGRDIKK